MKRIAFLLCIAVFYGSAAAQQVVPDVNLKTLEGRPAQLMTFAQQKKLTVLSFWATWCAPCKRELDAITEKLPSWMEQYDVQVIAVTIDDQRQLSKAKPMAAAQGWPFVLLSDPSSQLKNALNFQAIPYTVLINQKGEVLYEHSGYVPGDELELERKIATFSKD